LKNSDQLTRYLEKDLNERIFPITIKSVQVGNYYYRRVHLTTQRTNKTVVSAVLKISMSDLPSPVIKDIIEAETPFGRILDTNSIDYSCNVEDVFEVVSNSNSELNIQNSSSPQKLFGRYNCFKNKKKKVFAEVVEILTPDLQYLLNAESSK
jgi:chorismate-pyruvate lyase